MAGVLRCASIVSEIPSSPRRTRGNPRSSSSRVRAAPMLDTGWPQARDAARMPPCRNARSAIMIVELLMPLRIPCPYFDICHKKISDAMLIERKDRDGAGIGVS